MTTPPTGNTSSTARLMIDAPGFAVGWQTQVLIKAPAAGANWSYKVDGRYFERVLAVTFVLNTSAVVANRFPAVNVADNNGAIITSVPAGGTVVASTSLSVFLQLHAPAYAFGSSGGTFGFFPDLLLPPDWTISSLISGMDVGDTLTGIVLLVQRFPNDATSISAAE